MAAVVVIGASLAGMAAAARLAKAKHQVTLLEATDRLGGGWAATELDGVTVDAAPPIFAFPAPWRDLFRKSGRALEAEFARSGDELVGAPAARHVFPDGARFELPIGRGNQHAAISERYGPDAADRWQRLVDGLAEVWQALRPLGVESELTDRSQLSREVGKKLRRKETLADLARGIGEPDLGRIIADLAYPAGSDPARTPAFHAVQLYLERTFGRWTAGSGTTMINSLNRRLELRKVDLRIGTAATMITMVDDRVAGVLTDAGEIPADAVVAGCDPVQLYHRLLPRSAGRRERRRLDRLPPARVPTVAVGWLDGHTDHDEPTETVHHRDRGGPRIDYTRPVGTPTGRRTLRTSYEYAEPRTDPAAGPGWRGFGSWLDRPPVTSEVSGLFSAGRHSRGGAGPSAQVLSGALAAYGCARLIDPSRPLEPR